MISELYNSCWRGILCVLIVLSLAALLAFSAGVARSPVAQRVSHSHALAVKCQCDGTERAPVTFSR